MDGDFHDLSAHHDICMAHTKKLEARYDSDDVVDGLRVLEVLVAEVRADIIRPYGSRLVKILRYFNSLSH